MTNIEKGALLKLFNHGGYVLDFSTAEFDAFTLESVGVALCQKYKLSKGASLTAFCSAASEQDVTKLLFDLFQYYELSFLPDSYDGDKDKAALYEKCKGIIGKVRGAVAVETPSIKKIDREYVIDLSSRAIRDVENGEYDSAITKSRTLLEEVFIKVIEDKGIEPSDNGDINKLYNQVKQLYNMHQDKAYDKGSTVCCPGLKKSCLLSLKCVIRTATLME